MPASSPPALRILYVSHSFPSEGHPPAVGGMQRVAVELHEALHRVRRLALRSLLLRSEGLTHYLLAVPFILSLLWRVPRAVRRAPTDVVVFSSMVTAMVAWPLRRPLARAGVVTAAIVHGLDATNPFPLYQWLVRRALRSLDLVLPVSRSTAAICLSRGAHPDKVEVVPNGVSLGRFLPALRAVEGDVSGDGYGRIPAPEELLAPKDEARTLLAARYGAPELMARTTLICSVGRQIPRKGFDWFIRHAMPLLPPGVHYWLAGDGPLAEAIQEAAAEAGVADRVRLLGLVDEQELATLLRAADLFVMPNRPTPNDPEGFGVVMLEAGLCGTPTVAAALEGICDVIEDGENGHLVPTGSAAAFAETVLRYHRSPAELDAFACRTILYTADAFNWTSVAHSYVRALGTYALPPHEHAALETLPAEFDAALHALGLATPVPVLVPATAPATRIEAD